MGSDSKEKQGSLGSATSAELREVSIAATTIQCRIPPFTLPLPGHWTLVLPTTGTPSTATAVPVIATRMDSPPDLFGMIRAASLKLGQMY